MDNLSISTSTPRTHRARKRFGQNFLVDAGALSEIADLAGTAAEGDLVLEVGPGRGVLTAELLARLSHLVAIEIDRDLVRLLKGRFEKSSLRIIEGDVLDLDLVALLEEERKKRLVVVGNLPFNISTPVLFRLLDHASRIDRAILTLQKEVAERVVASPGSKSYGLISVLLRTRARGRICLDIPSKAFRPRPEVDAAVVELSFSGEWRFPVLNEAVFDSVARAAFGQRRKMLRNALRSLPPLLTANSGDGRYLADAELEAAAMTAGIDLTRRGETLEPEEFAILSDALVRAAEADAR